MKLFKNITSLALLTVLVISLNSCDFSGLNDAADDFKVVVELEPINTTSTVLLEDANSGELVEANVQIEFEGENGDDVIDIYSDPLPEEEVDGGVLNFGIDNSLSPTESSPVKVRLLAEASGYVSTAKTVTIESEGANEFRLKLIKENDKPEGVSSSSNTEGSADEEGTVQEDYSTSSDADTESGSSMDVASGTRFKDEDGTSLTGQLTTEVSYYDPSEVTAMSSIPVDLEDEEGNPIMVAGASQSSITDQNGRRAATAEVSAKSKVNNNGPLSYTFKIPSSVINPLAGRPYNEGDPAIIFIFDTSFNVFIENGTVEALEAGGLGVRYKSSVVPVIAVTGNPLLATASSCGANVTINRNGNNGALSGRVFTSGFVSEFRIPQGTNQYSISKVPDVDVTIELETPSGALVSQENVNVCGNLTIDLPAPPSNLIDATMEATLQCQNPDEVVSVTDLPGASVLYRKTTAEQGADWRMAGNLSWNFDEENNALTGGSFTVEDVLQGEEYKFKISFDGNNYERDVVITGETVTYTEVIEEDICG